MQNEKFSQRAFCSLGVVFGFRAVVAKILKRINLGAAFVGPDLPTQSTKLFGDILAVVSSIKKSIQCSVCREIRVPADRAREMHVMATGQGVVAHHRWGIRGLGQSAQNGIRNRTRLRLVFHRVKKTLQIMPSWFFWNIHPSVSGRNAQLLHVPPTRIRVGPAQDGNFKLGEESTDGFVGLHHEHLNQRMGEGVVLRHRIDDTTVFGKNQINIREIQVNHAVTATPGLDSFG